MIPDKYVVKELNALSYTVTKIYKSRRNEVVKISASDGRIDFVRKRYLYGNAEKEYNMLKALEGYRVPRVLYRADGELYLEYISGRTLLEALESSEKEGKPFDDEIRLLVEFLKEFYSRMPGMRYGDVNLRNFILNEALIYGVDLEEVTWGEAETDIGRAAAFLITYRPGFTNYKFNCMCLLINYAEERLGIKPRRIIDEMLAELREMEKRRGEKVLRQGEDFAEKFFKQVKF